jgi:hypothetical protein
MVYQRPRVHTSWLCLDAMQATVHAHVQLAAATSQDELLVCHIAHLALKPVTPASIDHLELLTTAVYAIIGIAKLLLHCSNAALPLCWLKIRRRCSVDNLLSTSQKVSFDPECAAALARGGPFYTAHVTELSTASAPSTWSAIFQRSQGDTYVIWLQPQSIAMTERHEKQRHHPFSVPSSKVA